MFLKRTMRYYRVWIYCCNVTLLLATVVFVILLIWFLSDIHMSLLPSVSLIHPSFIYAFFALALQGGMVQVNLFFYTFIFSPFLLLSLSSLCPFPLHLSPYLSALFVSSRFSSHTLSPSLIDFHVTPLPLTQSRLPSH